MQIAICDSDCAFRKELRKYIVEYKKNKRIQVDIYEFASGEALLSSELFFDLIFLAYRLPKANGMAVARKLRSRNIPCNIVFVTDYPDFVYESFEVNPYRFFKKPISKSDIESMLDAFWSQQKRIYSLAVIDDGDQKMINCNEIMYLEGDGKYCLVRTVKESLHSSKTISDILESLPEHCFFRTHRSYAVNMKYIRSIDNKTVTFINGEKALISRACLSEFIDAYNTFSEHFGSKV